jgi:signal transduction histidine kinase
VVIRTRRLQEANEALEKEVAHRKRLEEQKDEFIAVASHELRTPTTAIKGYTQLALRATEKTGNEHLIRSLRIVNEKADQLTRLVNEMLDVSRIERDALRLEPVLFDIGLLVEEAIGTIKLTAPDSAFSVNLTDVPVLVQADRQRIEQVLTNLVDNAARYVGRGSNNGRRIEIAVTTSDGGAICSVRDYGVGIPADQQGEVFERFFRARNVTTARYPYPGFGLGLFISHSIISRHGGRMWLDSTEGVGSTFYFSLPMFEGEPQS